MYSDHRIKKLLSDECLNYRIGGGKRLCKANDYVVAINIISLARCATTRADNAFGSGEVRV